ncbi:unnamed protein product [Amoebophrya sp. A25]|nr:unnamed protein product [Amoebophrya sp. A25]|eukprot:GSA25T00025615001.1
MYSNVGEIKPKKRGNNTPNPRGNNVPGTGRASLDSRVSKWIKEIEWFQGHENNEHLKGLIRGVITGTLQKNQRTFSSRFQYAPFKEFYDQWLEAKNAKAAPSSMENNEKESHLLKGIRQDLVPSTGGLFPSFLHEKLRKLQDANKDTETPAPLTTKELNLIVGPSNSGFSEHLFPEWAIYDLLRPFHDTELSTEIAKKQLKFHITHANFLDFLFEKGLDEMAHAHGKNADPKEHHNEVYDLALFLSYCWDVAQFRMREGPAAMLHEMITKKKYSYHRSTRQEAAFWKLTSGGINDKPTRAPAPVPPEVLRRVKVNWPKTVECFKEEAQHMETAEEVNDLVGHVAHAINLLAGMDGDDPETIEILNKSLRLASRSKEALAESMTLLYEACNGNPLDLHADIIYRERLCNFHQEVKKIKYCIRNKLWLRLEKQLNAQGFQAGLIEDHPQEAKKEIQVAKSMVLQANAMVTEIFTNVQMHKFSDESVHSFKTLVWWSEDFRTWAKQALMQKATLIDDILKFHYSKVDYNVGLGFAYLQKLGYDKYRTIIERWSIDLDAQMIEDREDMDETRIKEIENEWCKLKPYVMDGKAVLEKSGAAGLVQKIEQAKAALKREEKVKKDGTTKKSKPSTRSILKQVKQGKKVMSRTEKANTTNMEKLKKRGGIMKNAAKAGADDREEAEAMDVEVVEEEEQQEDVEMRPASQQDSDEGVGENEDEENNQEEEEEGEEEEEENEEPQNPNQTGGSTGGLSGEAGGSDGLEQAGNLSGGSGGSGLLLPPAPSVGLGLGGAAASMSPQKGSVGGLGGADASVKPQKGSASGLAGLDVADIDPCYLDPEGNIDSRLLNSFFDKKEDEYCDMMNKKEKHKLDELLKKAGDETKKILAIERQKNKKKEKELLLHSADDLFDDGGQDMDVDQGDIEAMAAEDLTDGHVFGEDDAMGEAEFEQYLTALKPVAAGGPSSSSTDKPYQQPITEKTSTTTATPTSNATTVESKLIGETTSKSLNAFDFDTSATSCQKLNTSAASAVVDLTEGEDNEQAQEGEQHTATITRRLNGLALSTIEEASDEDEGLSKGPVVVEEGNDESQDVDPEEAEPAEFPGLDHCRRNIKSCRFSGEFFEEVIGDNGYFATSPGKMSNEDKDQEQVVPEDEQAVKSPPQKKFRKDVQRTPATPQKQSATSTADRVVADRAGAADKVPAAAVAADAVVSDAVAVDANMADAVAADQDQQDQPLDEVTTFKKAAEVEVQPKQPAPTTTMKAVKKNNDKVKKSTTPKNKSDGAKSTTTPKATTSKTKKSPAASDDKKIKAKADSNGQKDKKVKSESKKDEQKETSAKSTNKKEKKASTTSEKNKKDEQTEPTSQDGKQGKQSKTKGKKGEQKDEEDKLLDTTDKAKKMKQRGKASTTTKAKDNASTTTATAKASTTTTKTEKASATTATATEKASTTTTTSTTEKAPTTTTDNKEDLETTNMDVAGRLEKEGIEW